MRRLTAGVIALSASAFVSADSARAPRFLCSSDAIVQRVHENFTPMHVAATYSTVRRHIAALKAISDPMSGVLDSQYGASLDAMREYLTSHLDNAEAMLATLDNAEVEPPADPIRAIEQAEKLSNGVATPPTVEHLLAFDPHYAGCGLRQFNDGLVVSDTTDGSGDGDRLAFTIERPASWMPTHTRGEASVYRIRSEAASGISYVVIRVLPRSEDEIESDPITLRKNVIDSTAFPNRHAIRYSLFEIFDLRATTTTFYDSSASRRGVSRSVNKHYFVTLDDHIVKIETSVKDLARNSEDLLSIAEIEREFNRVEPLFDEIVKRMRVTETE